MHCTSRLKTLSIILFCLASYGAMADAVKNTDANEDAVVAATSVANNSVPWSEAAMNHLPEAGRFQGRLDVHALQELIAHGEHLFDARFTILDGAGRPMATQAIIPTQRRRPARSEFSRTAGLDANACSSCHNVPMIGGAGDFSANVFVSEGFVQSDFDTTDPQFSNERNTNHLFGAGLVELLAREMSGDLKALRHSALVRARNTSQPVEQTLETKGVNFGMIIAMPDGTVDNTKVQGVDRDLTVRPFSHKGVMTSLRQFTINALNHHHGMQAEERFGARWTGTSDFDQDQHENEFDAVNVSALVAWQAALAPPRQTTPTDKRWQEAAARGRQVFEELDCAACHRPYLPLESLTFDDPGPLDAAGTLRPDETITRAYDLSLLAWAEYLERDENGHYKVPLYGDLKRHAIADRQVAALGNELLSQRFIERNVFITSELWGVASTAPYGHRGNITTMAELITAHGGQARQSRDAWEALPDDDRSALIAFLKTLTIEP